MNLLFKLLLTLSATSWMIIVYVIKENLTIFSIPNWIFHIILIILVLSLSWFSLLLSPLFGDESIEGCNDYSLADNAFLPVYLGYFFVSLSIPNCYTMVGLYLIVFVFTFLSQTQYFNPAYLLLGYHYYYVSTQNGTNFFLIKPGKVIRNKNEMELKGLRRINDTTFIERRQKND